MTDITKRTIDDYFNEFILTMLNTSNGALITELKVRWKEYCNTPVLKNDTVVDKGYVGDELVGLLRDCVSSTWGNPSLDKTQVLFDKFLHDKKLAKPSQQLVNAFLTDAVNRNMYDKKYSQEEVDTIRREAFEAGRHYYKVQIPNRGLDYGDLHFKYESYEQYLSFLNEKIIFDKIYPKKYKSINIDQLSKGHNGMGAPFDEDLTAPGS